MTFVNDILSGGDCENYTAFKLHLVAIRRITPASPDARGTVHPAHELAL